MLIFSRTVSSSVEMERQQYFSTEVTFLNYMICDIFVILLSLYHQGRSPLVSVRKELDYKTEDPHNNISEGQQLIWLPNQESKVDKWNKGLQCLESLRPLHSLLHL